MYSLQQYRRPMKECNSDAHSMAVAQVLLQEFEQWDIGHPSFAPAGILCAGMGLSQSHAKLQKQRVSLFFPSLVSRILQGVLPDCTHYCGENNWEKQPHSRDVVLGPPLPCKKGARGEGRCTSRGNAPGHPFLQAAIETRKRTASPVLLQPWNTLRSAQLMDRDLHDQIWLGTLGYSSLTAGLSSTIISSSKWNRDYAMWRAERWNSDLNGNNCPSNQWFADTLHHSPVTFFHEEKQHYGARDSGIKLKALARSWLLGYKMLSQLHPMKYEVPLPVQSHHWMQVFQFLLSHHGISQTKSKKILSFFSF